MIDLTITYPIEPHPSWVITDASKLQTYLSCPRKYFFEYVLGLRPEGRNHHFDFGTAWHDFMETVLRYDLDERSLELGYDNFLNTYRQWYSPATDMDWLPKNPGNAYEAMKTYIQKYKGEPLKVYRFKTKEGKLKPLLEISGCVPLTGDFLIYFRMDAIMYDERKDIVMALEHKTSAYDTKYYDMQWVLKQQPSVYTHALHSLFKNIQKVEGVTINASFFRKTGKNDHRRIPVNKSSEYMESWMWETIHWMEQIQWNFEQLHRTSPKDPVMRCFPRNGNACTEYNRLCSFHTLCRMHHNPTELMHRNKLPFGFKQEFWNPMDREENPANWEIIGTTQEDVKLTEVKHDKTKKKDTKPNTSSESSVQEESSRGSAGSGEGLFTKYLGE